MNFRIPSIEEIYNEYHRQTFFFMNGVYPRKIKNFDNILSDSIKKEYLLRFQNMIARNRESVDWKIYIYACASLLKNRFDLKILGSLSGNKLYRNYIKYTFTEEKQEQEIYDEILRSVQFLSMYNKENNFVFNDYFNEGLATIPLSLKHIYSGTISLYFYAALNPNYVVSLFNSYLDEQFQDLFQCSKYEFIEQFITPKYNTIIKYPRIRAICDKLEKKFQTIETDK